MPVFPLVESSSVLPGPNFPLARAWATMFEAARSFTDPPGCTTRLASNSIPGRSRVSRFESQQWSIADQFEAAPAEQTRNDSPRSWQVQWSKNQALPSIWPKLAAFEVGNDA